MHRTVSRVVVIAWVVTATTLLESADVYFVQNVSDLDFSEGGRPEPVGPSVSFGQRRRLRAMLPYAVISGEGEVYVTAVSARSPVSGDPAQAVVAIRVPSGRDVRGRLFWPKGDASGMVARVFTIPAHRGSTDDRRDFLERKLEHYESLLRADVPGTAWFRHQARKLRGELGLKTAPQGNRGRRFWGRRVDSVQDTLALVSGGRALSENLQLDRLLPRAEEAGETIPIASIPGITVREFDWKHLTDGLEPAKDPLAALIPFDQHVLFFSSFQAMVDVADDASEHGLPVLSFVEPRSEDARTRARYERQLGLSLNGVTRWIGPRLVRSIAMTGADPYLRTGADVALLLETGDTGALRQLVDAQVRLAARGHRAVRDVRGTIDGVRYGGVRSEDRSVCSYIAVLHGAVVVTNSLAQLERLIDVEKGRCEALASLQEYTFFRDRYPRGCAEESALLLISDATIRRWCGPRWRIGTSRRTRALAFMTELQAAYVGHLVGGGGEPEPLYRPDLEPVAGKLTFTSRGVRSSRYGTLEFQTPVLELEIDRVTKQEAELYGRWRDGYQRRWSNFFDPIAVRFHASAGRLAADVTVMPLIAGTDYRQLIDVTRGARIGERAGDPHRGSLLHFALALDRESPTVQQFTGFARTMAPQIQVDPLSWVGETLAVYADPDPVWKELAQAERPDAFLERRWHRLPVALHVEVRNGFKLAAFLAGLRAYIDQSGPGMTVWETREHHGEPYVRVAPSERARSSVPEGFDDVAVFYSASGDALTVTLNEDLLKRAIDREVARREARESREDGEPGELSGRAWIGESVCLQLDPRVLELVEPIFGEDYRRAMRMLSWGNLHILNEWKRRYPGEDPVALHERLWQRRLVCPGGGEYRWNEEWQTMESIVYGHPGEPKPGDAVPAVLRAITHAGFGLTFEEDGLRAAVELER